MAVPQPPDRKYRQILVHATQREERPEERGKKGDLTCFNFVFAPSDDKAKQIYEC